MKTKIKKSVTLAFMLLACIVFATQASAQSPRNKKSTEDKATASADKMKEKLSLNDAQHKSVYEINLKYAKIAKDNISAQKAAREDRIAKAKSLDKDKNEELKKVLTESQYAEYEKSSKKMRPHNKRAPKSYAHTSKNKKSAEDRATALADRMKEKLTLNDAQRQSVYEINLKYAKMGKDRKDRSSAQEVDKNNRMAKVQSIRQEKNEELKKVLTETQYAEYEKSLKEMRSHNKRGRKIIG